MFAPLVAAAALLSASALPQADTVTTRYRVDTRSESLLDLTGLGAGEQRQTVGMSSFLTVQLVDTADGRRFRVVVDSMTFEPGAPIPPALADSIRGVSWTGLLTDEGEVTDLQMPNGAASQQLSQIVNSFFPRTRADMQPGTTWVDTLDVTHSDSTTSADTRTITEWKVAGTEPFEGVDATRLDATFTLRATATSQSPQGRMDVEGTGSGRSTYFIGPRRSYLGSTTEMQTDMTLALPNSPMPVPVTTTTTTKVSQIR